MLILFYDDSNDNKRILLFISGNIILKSSMAWISKLKMESDISTKGENNSLDNEKYALISNSFWHRILFVMSTFAYNCFNGLTNAIIMVLLFISIQFYIPCRAHLVPITHIELYRQSRTKVTLCLSFAVQNEQLISNIWIHSTPSYVWILYCNKAHTKKIPFKAF